MMRDFTVMLLSLLLLSPAYRAGGQIIADHTVVDQYDQVPQQYIDSVKKMLVFMAGESHSGAYRSGPELLELLDPAFQVETYTTDPPPPFTDQRLRIGRPFMVGESSFFSQSGIDELKSHITDQALSGNPYDVMGFGWCWDMTWQNPPGGGLDPVHHVHWAGSSQGGPDGNQRWGLDAGDSALTGNRVCMDTYLQAVEEYRDYCETNGYPTRWVFTTGPVDGSDNNGTEQGFQRELKHDYIRAYVGEDPSRILFDYADILCWSNDGEQNMAEWDDGGDIRPHMQIHPDNRMDYDGSWNKVPFQDEDQDHIGEVGELRLAKAMWWMLARMAGWDPGALSVREVKEGSAVGDLLDDEGFSLTISGNLLEIRMDQPPYGGEVSLCSLSGQLLSRQSIGSDCIQFNAGSLPQGMYLITVSSRSDPPRSGMFFLHKP